MTSSSIPLAAHPPVQPDEQIPAPASAPRTPEADAAPLAPTQAQRRWSRSALVAVLLLVLAAAYVLWLSGQLAMYLPWPAPVLTAVHWFVLLALLVAAGAAVFYAARPVRAQPRALQAAPQTPAQPQQPPREVVQILADAERVSQANQAAILRLMNELQAIAEGDLTREATVSEDPTGAIADTINFTVEELRRLVVAVQSGATGVVQTMTRLERGSVDLLGTATRQLEDARNAGQVVLAMASGIATISDRAAQSADVADRSKAAASAGLQAVQETIVGMSEIRGGIQETAKRIKRLGESSQEVGETTELISSITEQINTLAMNAAIQASAAGEAGRGFAALAEEVRRLGRRSADASRRIGALVEAIQTDTQNASLAMERCTAGVVEGARIADRAGATLTQIDRISADLAQLVQEISTLAHEEAARAGETVDHIRAILAGTECTEHSARDSAALVKELSGIATQLREAASRFKTT